jgi:hypothetical protein
MPQPVANLEQMDEHLMEVVRALHGAVKQGVSHKNEPQIMDKAIEDCKEILDEIMKGKVKEWLN